MTSSDGKFEGYRVEEVLSRSSTTTVYRAFQESLQRTVLIKELRSDLAGDQDVIERFEREAKVCANIKHENIVDIFERSEKGDHIFLVMEYVSGCSMEEFIREYAALPLGTAYLAVVLAVMFQTLRGLAHAHSKGVIHRDIKPSNILISRDGWVKITDFGLSLFEGAPGITVPGAVVGTPAFLSPEAINGGAITYRSDIFSLGVTFYQLITREKIFFADHFSDSLKKVLSYHPPAISSLRPDFPVELDRIIAKMIEKNPAKRWASADEIITALEERFSPYSVNSNRIVKNFLETGGKLTIEPTVEPVPRKGKPRQFDKRKRGVYLGIPLILAVVASTYYLLFHQPSDQKEEFTEPSGQMSAPVEVQKADTTLSTIPAPIAQSAQEVVRKQSASVPGGASETAKESGFKGEGEKAGGEREPPPHPRRPQQEASSAAALPATPGTVRIQVEPWADVYLDDIFIDKTPFAPIPIPPGRHRLVFQHPEFPPVFQDIETKPGEELQVQVNLWSTVGRIFVIVDTWANVYIDDRLVGVTPFSEPIIVPLGKHLVTLENPKFPIWRKEISFNRDDPPCTLKVEFKSVHGTISPSEPPAEMQTDSTRLSGFLPADTSHTQRK
jgi:serine/threonine protein kinase